MLVSLLFGICELLREGIDFFELVDKTKFIFYNDNEAKPVGWYYLCILIVLPFGRGVDLQETKWNKNNIYWG